MPEDDPVRLDIRLSGQIVRFHTWPSLRKQTIAEHGWNLCRIYFCITDNPDPKFIHHLIFHDIGENVTGDAPYPVKKDNPGLKDMMDVIEHKSYALQLDFWGSLQFASADIDKDLFKQIELVEMAEWGMDELCLGNTHGFIVADRCLRPLYNQKPCPRLIEYVITRIYLFKQQYVGVFLTKEDKRPWWYSEKWKEKLNERS